MPDPVSSDSAEEVNLRVARPLLAYLADTQGADVCDEVLTAAGLMPGEFDQEDRWVSQEEFEEVLAAGHRRLRGDEEFVKACQYEIAKQYGPLTLVLRFASMRTIVETLDRTRHLVTRIGRFEAERLSGPNAVRIRYRSTKAESRLPCLVRQAQWATIPQAIWGLPQAVVTERKCIADGDDCCECDVRWQDPFRWRAPVLGVALGAAVGVALWWLTGLMWFAPWPSLLGLVAGLHWSVMRLERTKEAFMEAKSVEAERFVARHMVATNELLRLHQRQEDWTAQVERQSLHSSHTLGAVLTRLQSITHRDSKAVRDISHDLRNPLTLVRVSADLLSEAVRDRAEPAVLERYSEHLQTGVQRLNEMLDEVMRLAGTPSEPTVDYAPRKVIDTAPLEDRYRRQLLALTVDRDLKISVELTRETPAHLETRPSILERVMDNLLTNAAKYTERGRIHVEISGVPGFLCLKVADTGRGIRPERLEGVLTGSQMDDAPLVGDSRGLGLSVVVRLLDHLGGRLEVLSRHDMGTTFWVYVPTQPTERLRPDVGDEPIERVIRRVVTIRDDSVNLPEISDLYH
jgi:signal transduction histidine kinase